LLLIVAVSLSLAQDVPGAVKAFDRAVLRQMTVRADSLLYARRFAAAETAYTELLAADSSYGYGRLGLATARYYQRRAGNADNGAVLDGLRQAAELAPLDPLAQLRYGEALLPWRLPNASAETDSERLVRATRLLERALELAPSRVEPHLPLYFASLARGDVASAGAGLRTARAAGFFPQPVLDFGYNLLVSSDSGGFLFANGDMDLFPVLALQADGLRTDVTVVSIPLLEARWYVRYLKARGLPISFTADELETLGGRYDKKLERTLTPGERILESAVEHRREVRGGFYFPVTVRREILELFKSALSLEGFVYRIADDKDVIPVNEPRFSANLNERYREPDFRDMPVWRANSSPLTRDYSVLARDCAAALWGLADEYRSRGDVTRASGYCRRACSMLADAGKWEGLEKVLNYWLKMAPLDPDALRLKKDYYGE
jgi:hypothetical protein